MLGQDRGVRLTLRLLLVSLLDPALPGVNPVQVVHLGGHWTRRGAAVGHTGPPATLDGHKEK